MKLKGKTALITGSTSGIGQSMAIMFAQEGAKVIVTGRNDERGRAVVSDIKAKNGEAVFIRADLLKMDELDYLFDESIKAYGNLDILVNNSGIAPSVPFEDVTEEIWKSVFDTNLTAVYRLTQKALPYLLKSKGNVLTISSIAGLVPINLLYAYNASKSAVIMLMRTLAKDYAEKGVRFNAICPGSTATPILSTLDQELQKSIEASIPMKRLADPKEMAKAALFLVSDDGSYVTGHALVVDGGLSL